MATIESTSRESDGTITAWTDPLFDNRALEPGVEFGLLRLLLPLELKPEQIAGRYLLARCGAQSEFERATQWGIYFRRPLFFASYFKQQTVQSLGQLVDADSSDSLSSNDTAANDTAANDTGSNIESSKVMAACQFVVPYQPFIGSTVSPPRYVIDKTAAGDETAGGQHSFHAAIADPGYAWLATLGDQEPVNLMGPFGNGFALHPDSRNLLLIANGWRIAKLLPLIEVMLNRGGRITIAVKASSTAEQEALQTFLLPMLPIAVELRLAASAKSWEKDLLDTLVWADQLCAALPEVDLPGLGMLIREKRFHLQEGFAQILVDADLICGVGACLACVVNTANGGHTRACVNGPVFDLIRLQR